MNNYILMLQPFNAIMFLLIVIFSIFKLISKRVNIFKITGFYLSLYNILISSIVLIIVFIGFFIFLFLNIKFGYISIINTNELILSLNQVLSQLSTAFVEEMLMRGFLFIGLLFIFPNKIFAVITSSIIFSLAHISDSFFIGFISYFIAGVMYSLALIRFKTIIVPIVLHFSWNFFQGSFFGFPVGGSPSNGVFILKIEPNIFFNGGTSGPEESIFGIILRVLFILTIFILSFFYKNSSEKKFLNLHNA